MTIYIVSITTSIPPPTCPGYINYYWKVTRPIQIVCQLCGVKHWRGFYLIFSIDSLAIQCMPHCVFGENVPN